MYITVEGLDGSGGTTLVEGLGKKYKSVTTTAEPSDMWTGTGVRRCLNDSSTDPLTDFYFFLGDRVNHVENRVRPLDELGETVISDRYADSTRVYQPIALSESDHFDTQAEARLFIEDSMSQWLYEPDVTIYLDVSVETALERGDREEKYENREYLEQVKWNYDRLVENESDRFIVIDAEQSEEDVLSETISALQRESYLRE